MCVCVCVCFCSDLTAPASTDGPPNTRRSSKRKRPSQVSHGPETASTTQPIARTNTPFGALIDPAPFSLSSSLGESGSDSTSLIAASERAAISSLPRHGGTHHQISRRNMASFDHDVANRTTPSVLGPRVSGRGSGGSSSSSQDRKSSSPLRRSRTGGRSSGQRSGRLPRPRSSSSSSRGARAAVAAPAVAEVPPDMSCVRVLWVLEQERRELRRLAFCLRKIAFLATLIGQPGANQQQRQQQNHTHTQVGADQTPAAAPSSSFHASTSQSTQISVSARVGAALAFARSEFGALECAESAAELQELMGCLAFARLLVHPDCAVEAIDSHSNTPPSSSSSSSSSSAQVGISAHVCCTVLSLCIYTHSFCVCGCVCAQGGGLEMRSIAAEVLRVEANPFPHLFEAPEHDCLHGGVCVSVCICVRTHVYVCMTTRAVFIIRCIACVTRTGVIVSRALWTHALSLFQACYARTTGVPAQDPIFIAFQV
jgi:hypothetical protein